MLVKPAPRLSIRRPNAVLVGDSKNEFFMAFESKGERSEWMETINQVHKIYLIMIFLIEYIEGRSCNQLSLS